MTLRLLGLFATTTVLGAAAPCASIQSLPKELQPDTRSSKKMAALEETAARCDKLASAEVGLSEEKAVGGAVAVAWVSKGGGLMLDYPQTPISGLRDPKKVVLRPSPENDLHRYLNRVGKNLGAQSARPELPWTFGVLRSEAANALSAPGGYVFVTRGLLRTVDNESQLSGVLAHEIGHVVGRHALKAYGAVKANQCRLALVGDLGKEVLGLNSASSRQAQISPSLRSTFQAMADATGGVVDLDNPKNFDALAKLTDAAVDSVTTRGFAHDDEYEADRVAAALLINAGYNPHEFIGLLSKIHGGGAFANHPSSRDRQERLRRFIASLDPKGQPLANPDWDFQKYPKVPLAAELTLAR